MMQQSNSLLPSDYITWLKSRGTLVFARGDWSWMLYQRALIPATIAPCYLSLLPPDAQDLLDASDALMLRYSSDPCEQETEWWYVVCDRYHPQTFKSKTRQNISKGGRECDVVRVAPEWLADRGYSCYLGGHGRHQGAVPMTEDEFQKTVSACIGGPIEFWAVIVQQQLACFLKCTYEGNFVNTTWGKYDPAFFKHKPVDALINRLGEHYVRDQGRILVNGNRSAFHDTRMQGFLLEHGFRRQFCRLNLIYRNWLGVAIRGIYPARRILRRLSKTGTLGAMSALLWQEQIRRSCWSIAISRNRLS